MRTIEDETKTDTTHLIESSARALSKSFISSFFLSLALTFIETGLVREAA